MLVDKYLITLISKEYDFSFNNIPHRKGLYYIRPSDHTEEGQCAF